MPSIEYMANVYIFIHRTGEAKTEKKIDLLRYYVHSFEVDGASAGKTILSRTNEAIVKARFEEIRTHGNVILYIKSSREEPTSKLIEAAKSGASGFTTSFGIRAVKDEEITLTATSVQAKGSFAETPIPVGGTPPMLKVKLNLAAPTFFYGVREKNKVNLHRVEI